MLSNFFTIYSTNTGVEVINARELYEALEIKKDFSSWIKSKIKNCKEDYDYIKKVIKATSTTPKKVEYYLIKELVIMIIHNSRKTPAMKNLLDAIGLNNIVLANRAEVDFFDALEQSLKPFNLKVESQYNILNYRLDGYIKNLNLAIEYDEIQHFNSTNMEQDSIRENDIKKEIGCSFVRVKDSDNMNYNIGIVLKSIMELI